MVSSAGDKGSGEGDSGRWAENRRHWEATLDALNLRPEPRPGDLERDVAFFETADVRWALGQLEPLRGRLVLDLGGGLGLGAVLLAQRGARTVICDLSHPRLREARRSLASAGLATDVCYVVAAAEHLPFADGAVDRLFTKSVLIHTRLAEASAECGRVLARDGAAALIEPQRRHPLVNLYRRLAAPAIWRSITTYFSPEEFRVVAAGLGSPASSVRPFFLLGFLASVFAFLVPAPRLYRTAETILCGLDRALLAVAPTLGKFAWFGVLVHRRRSL